MTGIQKARTRPLPGPGLPAAQRARRMAVAGGAAVLVFAAFCFTPPGAKSMAACHRFLDFYGGVFSLVALSLTVMGGLAATDRLILLVRHRVLLQAVHRATAAAAMVFLGVHIAMKVVSGRARLVDAVVPFLAHHRSGYVGLGTIAAYLMGIAAWTGVARGRFAELSRPAIWRVLHAGAYAAWPIAIVHGLASGRSAAGWVTASYAICLVAVALASLVRLSVHWGRQRASTGSTTGSLPRIGAQRSKPAVATPPLAVPVSPVRLPTGAQPLVQPTSVPPTSAQPTSVPPTSVPPTLVQPSFGREPVSLAWDYPPRPTGPAPEPERVPMPPPPLPPRPARPSASGPRTDRRTRRRAADTAPPAPRTFESVSDDEFWAVMRGDRS